MGDPAAPAPDTVAQGLAAAHQALLKRRDLQFDLPGLVQQPPRDPPGWLKAILEFLAHMFVGLAPLLDFLFWGLVAAAVAGVLYLIVREVGWGDMIGKSRKKALNADYRPEASLAKALLADADELAAQGRFDEAVHILLLRSIDDMQRFRPGSVRPAATSRDIAGLDVLPQAARPAFAAMAERVEISLFGARPVDAAGFAQTRADYEAFAFPTAWT